MEILTTPILWLGVAIVVIALIESKRQKSSTKAKEPNKTSRTSKPRRARTSKGKFVADNPNTPKNEAWEGGKAPKKKSSSTARKTAKKTTKRTPKKRASKN